MIDKVLVTLNSLQLDYSEDTYIHVHVKIYVFTCINKLLVILVFNLDMRLVANKEKKHEKHP